MDSLPPEEIPRSQQAISVLWPSFIMAIVASGVFFSAFDPRDYMKPARSAMKEVVKARMIAFGQAGQGDKVPRQSLEDMRSRYHDMNPAG